MQVMQGAQGGAALLQLPSRGAPQSVGGRTTLPAGAGGGGRLQQRARVLPSGGSAIMPVPVTGGEGRGSAGQGTAASPRSGTQGPNKGHGRASEEGT